jgi:hypothetical protein
MGKLDAAALMGVVVNGPEDEILGWDAVNWRVVEDDVRRLRQRIFTATQAGDFKKVRNLQKLMLRFPRECTDLGAAGDGDQRWPQDGRGRRADGGG